MTTTGMRFFISLLLLFAFIPARSGSVATDENDPPWQQTERHRIDSIKQLVDTQLYTEKQKIDIYLYIANSYGNFELDSSVFYATKGITLAEKLKEYEILMELHIILGVTSCFKGDFDTAFACFDQAKKLAVEQGNKDKEMDALSLTAYAYAKQGKFHTAMDYYLKVLKIHETAGGTKADRYILTLTNLSEINRRLGNTETAIQYLKQAEEKCNELEKDLYISGWRAPQVWNEYAFNYLKQGDLEKAFHYALKADSANMPHGTVNRCYTKGLLATIYLQRNDCDRALQYAREAYEEAEVLKDISLYAYAGKILSDVYLAQKRYSEAEAEALKVWESYATYVDDSQALVENIALANIYMGHTEKAAYYLKKYSELNAQYSEKSFQTIVSDLSIQYETDKKEMRISSLEQQRILYISISFVGVLLAVTLWIVFRQKLRQERYEKQLIAAEAVRKWEKEERKQFASNIHDGVSGMLSAIKLELNATEHFQEIRNKLDDCIETIRRIARGMMPVSLERYGLKAALEDYCRSFPNVQFYFFGETRRMDEKTELTVYYCAYELVNNAFNHSDAANINVQLVQDDNRISLTIQDDGCGFDRETFVRGAGIKSISDRVSALNGQLDIATLPGKGTEVTIELRVKN